jgi:type II secretory pathway pseudopilin PulG
MAALIVALGVMSILASAAMPVWKQVTQREKEEELIFRGQQYARAIGLFQRRAGPGVNPPSLDVLVQQRFLRKKYLDPITGEDYFPLTAAAVAQAGLGAADREGSDDPGGRGPGRAGGPSSAPATGRGPSQPATAGRGFPAPSFGGGAQTPVGRGPQLPGGGTLGAQGGIVGVVSKSTDTSIRIFNGRTKYNEWVFVYTAPVQAPGVGGRGGATPGTPVPGIGGRGPAFPGIGGRGRGPQSPVLPPQPGGGTQAPPRIPGN